MTITDIPPKISPEEAKRRGLIKIMDRGSTGKVSGHWDAGCYVDPVKVAEFQKRGGMAGWGKK